jgi:endo-1,4-beta-xylanase
VRAVAAILAGTALLLATGCGATDTAQAPEVTPFPRGAAERVEPPRPEVPLGAAVTWSTLEQDPELKALVPRVFDSVTPENDMKPERMWPERGEYAFGPADALVGWARDNGLRVRGHTLVWHQQVPQWLRRDDWTPAALERTMTEHIRTTVARYRDRVDTWDVVNEPFTDQGELRTGNDAPYLPVLGRRYIEVALRAARAADPQARLFVNEIGAETGGPKLDALVALARDLTARGVPLDGIGLEFHLTADVPPARRRLQRTIERLAGLDLDVEVTELDVAGGAPAAIYADVGAACAAVARCRRVTIWGVSDRDSWLGADQRPLPFDARLRTKPAWPALTRELRRPRG